MYKQLASCLVLAMLMLAFIGCEHKSVNTSERSDSRANPTIISDRRVITDTSLEKRAGVAEVRETTTPNGFYRVHVEVLNNTVERVRVNYRFEWFDRNGAPISSDMSAWRPLGLKGKESIWLTDVAPTKDAVDFRLKLVEAGG